MSNEFEKRVQQMMDELKLVPSEPVWQKVELQIRKKKDRRRMVLWIPILVLLLGGSLWIGIDQYSNQGSYKMSNNEIKKNNNKTPDQNSITTSVTATKKKTTDPANTITKIDRPQNENANEVVKTKNINIDISQSPVVQKKPSQKIRETKENLVEVGKEVPATIEETELIQAEVPEQIVQLSIKKLNQVVSNFNIIPSADTIVAYPFDEMKMKPAISIPDSVKHDTASIKNPGTKKLAESKWRYNLVVTSGLSGLSRLNFFNGQKSMDALYNSPATGSTGPGIIYYGPSSVKKGLSFSIGGATQKQLSKHLVFSAGLQYNYYSNSIQVGNLTRRDTVFRGAYSVSQYFRNSAATYSMDIAPYHNHYHFISLPLTINWQMFRKLPLNFHTGFSIQQMIQTNALTFDYNAQAYYHNNKAFNKTLLFTEYGFNYSIPFAKHYLVLGPQLQYGLTALEKNNSTHHLFSYGLKAQLQFNKK